MAVQAVNTYSFNVKRLSQMVQTTSPTALGPMNPSYNGETAFVVATTPANALAVLTSFYGSDLGPVSGGATLVPNALTSLA